MKKNMKRQAIIAYLQHVEDDEEQDNFWELVEGDNLVGKDLGQCHIGINLQNISNKHLMINIDHYEITIEDLNSKKGVFKEIEQQQIQKLRPKKLYDLQEHQIFYISEYKFKISRCLDPKTSKVQFQQTIVQTLTNPTEEISETGEPNIKLTNNKKTKNNTKSKSQLQSQKSTKIMISGFTLIQPQIQDLKSLGIVVKQQIDQDYDYLVINSFLRSPKLLLSIIRAKTIINFDWISACLRQKKKLDIDKYFFDFSKAEEEYRFDFQKTIELASENKGVFLGLTFWFPDNLSNKEDLKYVIESGGGKVVPQLNKNKKNLILVIINDQKKQRKEGYKMFTIDFITSAVLSQHIDWETYAIQ